MRNIFSVALIGLIVAVCSISAFAEGGMPPTTTSPILTEADWARIVDGQKRQVKLLDLYVMDAAKYAVGDWSEIDYEFHVDVNNGVFALKPTSFAAKKYVAVSYFEGGPDRRSMSAIFQGVTPFTVVPGQTTLVTIVAKMLPDMHYAFVVANLPATFDPNTNNVNVDLTVGGQHYSGYLTTNDAGQLVVNVWAPYELSGPGDLVISDANNSVACYTNFNVFTALNGTFTIPYQPSPNFDGAKFAVVFVHENKFVKVGNQFYGSIQEAINANVANYPINIQVGEGNYDGAIVPAGIPVWVNGYGADLSIINGRIWSSVFGDPVYHIDGRGKAATDDAASPEVSNASELMTKGGEFYLRLSNLQVRLGRDYPNSWYSDAAVVLEGGSLSISNCVIRSDSNRPVSVNYNYGVTIDHSVLYGSGYVGIENNYGSDNFVITNSILLHNGVVFSGSYAGNQISLSNCIIWDFNSLSSGNFRLVQSGVLLSDPLIDLNTWRCDPNGPAGNSIGIDWRG